jgi:RimJ/RimL family protein N-acetyltransferase
MGKGISWISSILLPSTRSRRRRTEEVQAVIDVREYKAHETLKDGRSVIVRAVRPDDKTTILQGVSLFSNDSLYKRFHGVKTTLTDQELKYYTDIDYHHHIALLAVSEENSQAIGGGRLIAYGEAMPPRIAELAFAVVDNFQGLGAGTLIFKHLIKISREIGIKTLEADVLTENTAMIRLFEKSGLPVTKTYEGRSVHVTMSL